MPRPLAAARVLDFTLPAWLSAPIWPPSTLNTEAVYRWRCRYRAVASKHHPPIEAATWRPCTAWGRSASWCWRRCLIRARRTSPTTWRT